MAKPTLALIPASQGSKVFSVLPSSGVGDFDFSRGSAATRINSQGLIENVASGQSRLDYPLIDGVVNGCPSLLLEPQRTNLVTYSEDFSNAYWNKTGASVVSDAAISPDGSLNADKLVEDTSTGTKFLRASGFSQLATDNVSLSIYAKAAENKSVILYEDYSDAGVVFNLETEVITAYRGSPVSSSMEALPNGWYRLNLTVFPNYTISQYKVITVNQAGDFSYTGDGTSGIYIFGAQLEVSSYPTSYIPTNGAAVTRSAETANGAGDATTFNDSEGVLMAEIANISENQTTTVAFSLSDGSLINSISVYYFGTSGLYYDIFNSAGTRSGSTPMTKIQQTSNNKISLKYKSGDIALWVNGFEVNTNVGTLSLSGLSELNLDYGNGGFPFYGKTKQIQYYNTVLTDSELEQLTSWISFTDMANGQLYTIE